MPGMSGWSSFPDISSQMNVNDMDNGVRNQGLLDSLMSNIIFLFNCVDLFLSAF